MPAQAAQSSGTAGQPTPVQGKAAETAQAEGVQLSTAAAASSPTTIVRYNRLYKTPAIPPSKCTEVRGTINTYAAVKAYDTKMVNCLWAAWAPIVKAAGGAYRLKPTLIVHNYSRVNTKCGIVSGPTSYFCGYKNGQIYIPWGYIANMWKTNHTYARAYATNTIAHEYGHMVQYVTGILNASWTRQRAFTTNSAKLEESRRRELQASCLGSAYIGANKRYYPMSGALYTQWKYLVAHSGDMKGYPRDHGSFANHNFWSTAGFNATSSRTYASRCNTFNAVSSRVS
jgi:predicted metalloprotease